MKTYIGTKIVHAEPMDELTFMRKYRNVNKLIGINRPGYHVVYADKYGSWSPKEVFEIAYREITDSEAKMVKNDTGEENIV